MTGNLTFVSAGAGSGKTHKLTTILHAELTSGRARPSGVIATTFTVKAATELRERVRAHLLAQGSFALATAVEQARIGTVNAVCGALLERFAFEAGIATSQQVLEEEAAVSVLARAIDAVRDDAALGSFLAIVRRLGLVDSWKGHLADLVDRVRANGIHPDDLGRFAEENAEELLAHFGAPSKADLGRDLQATISLALPAIEKAAAERGLKNTGKYLSVVRDFQRAMQNGGAPWGDWIKLSKEKGEVALRATIEPISEIAARAASHPGLHADVRAYLVQMFDLCGKALEVYALAKRELGVLDFTDQESLLLGLLDNPAVQEVIRDELDLLLVDEFQDTSPIQLALFLKLARLAQSVYWVGDVKQAIYGFRGSDTALMEAVVRSLPAFGGKKEILDESYRSRRELVDIVNAAFTGAFAGTLPPQEVRLNPTRTEPLAGAPIANWILGGKNVDEEFHALAIAVRRLIAQAYPVLPKHEKAPRAVRLGDIAILARTNDNVERIAAALVAAGIACETKQPGLLKTPEATLALACVRRLNDPSDTVATAEIVSLCDGDDPETWVAERLRYLRDGGEKDAWREQDFGDYPAHPLVQHLGQMRGSLALLSPKEALQAVIVGCDLSRIVTRWSAGSDRARQRLANLEELLALGEKYEDLCRTGHHAASVSGLLLWLGEIADEGADHIAQPAIDAVKVLTHHRAKGLEWPVVILTGLNATNRDRLWGVSVQADGAFDVAAPLANRRLRYWPWPFGRQQNVPALAGIEASQTAEQFRRAAIEEGKRLLYVSMTRARDLLVFARSRREPVGDWLSTIDSPWLLPDDDRESMVLPGGGRIDTMHWEVSPEEGGETAPAEQGIRLRWFRRTESDQGRLPLYCNPSDSRTIPATVVETVKIGRGIEVKALTDWAQLGTAIHACTAAFFASGDVSMGNGEVKEILDGYSLGGVVAAEDVLAQILTLRDWIKGRWPGAQCLTEWPVEEAMENRQQLRGRVDLLIRSDKGWILIDHKTSPIRDGGWEEFAKLHASQLDAYASAIEGASGVPVVERWLFLPISGGAIRLRNE